MKISIHSDGTPSGTVVISETGEKIDGVTGVDFSIHAGQVGEVTLTLTEANVILTGDLGQAYHTCRGCGGAVDHVCNPGLGGTAPSACGAMTTDQTMICKMPWGHAGNHDYRPVI